jgi:lipoprotein YgeR
VVPTGMLTKNSKKGNNIRFPSAARTGTALFLLCIFFLYLSCAPSRNRITGKRNFHRKAERNNSTEFAVEHFSWRDTSNEDSTAHYTLRERNSPNHLVPNDTNTLYQKGKRYRETEKKQKRNGALRTKNREGKSRYPYTFYRIRKGDTLYRISKRFNTPVKKIISINRIKDTRNIKIGTKLKIPQTNPITAPQHKRVSKKNLHFSWPIQNKIKIRRDGQKGVKSIGIFITGKPGEHVLSSATGVVKKIGRMRGFGNYVVIKHSKRYMTVYSNLDSITVVEGEKIKRGEHIGRIHNSDNELHFQINYSGKPQDPLRLLPKS